MMNQSEMHFGPFNSPRPLTVTTIGVYGFDEEGFFRVLQEARVDTFCDIRARRGVRGSKYAFANSKRLQSHLSELGIQYHHFPALAPTKEIRDRQRNADKATRIAKRKRTTLDEAFIEAYREEVLTDFDATSFLNELGEASRVIVLFCVEKEPLACHRSLVAESLQQQLELEIVHLLPE